MWISRATWRNPSRWSDFRKVSTIAGIAVAVAIILSVLATLSGWIPLLYAGIPAWIAGVLVWRSAPRRTRIQGMVLLAIGLGGMALSAQQGVALDWRQAIAGNAALMAMLAAVSFLRLITAPTQTETMPQGRRSLWRTLLGVHFFGAVVNLSTVLIMARRMAPDGVLTRNQYQVLIKGFSSAGFWSPFFAAMAAALTFAPGARLSELMIFGSGLAAVALVLAVLEASRRGIQDFVGYPMNPAALWLPALLAAMILIGHAIWPDVPVLGLVTLLAPVVTAVTLMVRRAPTARLLASHVTGSLSSMHGELVLFLSAGVTAAGLSSLVAAFEPALPFDQFAAPQAGIMLALLVLAAIVGIHPVIGIAAAAAIVAPLSPDPSLLASTFLAAWSIGIAVGPLSGLNLALQGTYGFTPGQILRWNAGYALMMVIAAALLFYLHPALL